MRAFLVIFAAIASTLSLGCTEANLQLYVNPDNPYLRMAVEGHVCAPPPVEEEVPYKVLFVVDTSGSTSTSDPTPPSGYSRRELAVRLAISEHADQENVSFAIITFSSEPRRQTFGFTRDLEILDGAADNIGLSQGGTNYSDTLWTGIDFILNDHRDLDPRTARRTHYIIFWLSDGEPTVGVTNISAIIPGVTFLRNSLAETAGGFAFNSFFIGGAQEESDGTAEALLRAMAAEGDGMFVDVAAGESFELDIDPAPMRREFELIEAFVANMATHYGATHPLADSDVDGLVDEYEIEIGTDPTKRDTDGDGVRDGLEGPMTGTDPLVADITCLEDDDRDGDGLLTCEELRLGTDPKSPDTDGDGLLDGAEILLGGFPLTADRGQDADLDGLGNIYELRAHLDPRIPNGPEDQKRWEYRYEILSAGGVSTAQPCYYIAVDNIGLYETLETDVGAKGDNPISVVVTFAPLDGGDERVYARYRTTARFILPDIREPVNGKIRPSPEEFVLLPTP